MTFIIQDHYFKKAKEENFLARSIYKLEEIQKKFKVLKASDKVLDLGYYPGSWIQYAAAVVGKEGRVVGVDIQEVNQALSLYKNVQLHCLDAFELEGPQQLGAEMVDGFNCVLSDMAPNTSGIRSLDQDRSLNLVEKVFSILPRFLAKNGNFVIKVFESGKAQEFLKEHRKVFSEHFYLKPKSTRTISKEFFFIGKGFRP